MKILSVAYPLFPVGPDASGGAEQILFLTEREIVRAEHESLVVAATGSRVSGHLIETRSYEGELTESVRLEAQAEHREAIAATLKHEHVDLIHFHGLDFCSYVPEEAVSMLASLHLPLSWYPDTTFHQDRVKLVCVSKSQATGTEYSVVTNGVDLEDYANAASDRINYLLWLGRICPEKGVHIALRVAHTLNCELIIAGPVHAFETHQRYFCEQVIPLLDNKRRYIGPVAGGAKSKLLANARCLLIPSLVAETSSLVAMEAIRAGTAVVAFRSGALPEVVDDEVTGYIVDSEAEMMSAVQSVDRISPATCCKIAKERFDARRMAAEYLELYRSVMIDRE